MSPTAAQLLQPENLSLEIATTDKDTAILEVAAIMQNSPDLSDFKRFCQELLIRDQLRSTAAGYGVAFPHARTDAVREIVIAAGRSTPGILFGEERVHFIFVIGTPREKAADYLIAVGTLARRMRIEKTRTALRKAATPGEFMQILNR